MIGELGDDGWVRVEWANGTTNSYRMGMEGKYDLTLASPPSPVVSETETEEPSVNSKGLSEFFWYRNVFCCGESEEKHSFFNSLA